MHQSFDTITEDSLASVFLQLVGTNFKTQIVNKTFEHKLIKLSVQQSILGREQTAKC